MPLCYIFTNLKSDEISEDLEVKLQECIEEILNKPADVSIFPDISSITIKYIGIIEISVHSCMNVHTQIENDSISV